MTQAQTLSAGNTLQIGPSSEDTVRNASADNGASASNHTAARLGEEDTKLKLRWAQQKSM